MKLFIDALQPLYEGKEITKQKHTIPENMEKGIVGGVGIPLLLVSLKKLNIHIPITKTS